MFVIDRVELPLLNQAQQMWNLDREDSLGGQQTFQAGDEVIQVGNVGKHVVRGDEIGASFGCELFSERTSEELHHGSNTGRLCDRCDVLRRLDAEDGNPTRNEVLEEIAVVARDFDDM